MSELNKALCAARLEASGVIFKAGTNKHQGYGYVGHEHVIRHGAREALAKHGLSLLLVSYDLERTDVPAGKIQCQMWRGDFVLLHASGEERALVYRATIQANDKSAFVASTSLERVGLQRVLQLTGSSDEDVEHYENTDAPGFEPPRGGATNGHAAAQAPQGPPPIDRHVQGLIDRLQHATAANIEELRAEARGVFRSIYPHERQALSDAVEFAKTALEREAQDRAAEAAAQQAPASAGGAQ